jgi:hypothetical protein
MKLICLWCLREGKYGKLVESDLPHDRLSAHRICARHEAQLLVDIPSPSFPEIELLVVVHRGGQDLFEYLQQRLSGLRGVQVILERRMADRRRRARAGQSERRSFSRRLRVGQVSPLGYTIVHFVRK